MAKLLQLRRGTTSQHSSFTGAVGEVTVDTDKDVVVVHDGSTAGGKPMQAEDAELTELATMASGTAGALADLTQTEVEILDGATVTTAELNILDGVTSTAAELNLLDGVTSTTAELNILDGVTSTTAELNVLDGIPGTLTATELGYVDGVTSAIQTQIDTKAPLASPTFTGTVAIPNIANLETAVAANTAKVTNVTTNLSVTANGTSLTVASSDGTDATIPAVTTSAWGAMTDEDKTKLDGIATGAKVGDAVLANDQNWTGAQRGAITALSSSSNSTAVDFNSGNNFSLTLGENSTLAQPSNQTAGQSGSIFVTQDGTGGRTLSYHADWKWVGGSGSAPTVTATANAVSRIDYIVAAANKVHAVASLDVK